MTHQSREDDDQATGLPDLPKLIFLDTNIVQNLHSFGEFIFDRVSTPDLEKKLSTLGPRITADIYALADFMALGVRAGWPLAVSPGTQREFRAIQDPNKRDALTAWEQELADYFAENFDQSQGETEGSSYSETTRFTSIQRSRMADLLKAFPDKQDQQLFIDAVERGCDVFLTMDYKTIWQHRDKVKQFGLHVMRPVELLEYVRPWAGLLA
jgi:hypothetical protein